MYGAVAVSTGGMAGRTETGSPHLLIRRKNQKIFLGSDLARRYKSACVQAKSFPESSRREDGVVTAGYGCYDRSHLTLCRKMNLARGPTLPHGA